MEEYTYSSLLPEAIRGRNQQGVKNTKRSMLISGLCLLLTAVMLMGSTFAWFTDSVTNEGNKIEAGTLDISLNGDSEEVLFHSDDFLFEPGRSQMNTVTVSNVGTLWLKYTMSFANMEIIGDADITEVLDVYKVPGETATAANLNDTTYLGTMKSLMAAGSFAAKDAALAPQGDESGNEGDICIKQYATGYSFTISDCTFEGFATSIQLFDAAGGSITGCTFDSDLVDISLSRLSGKVTISGNTYTAGKQENIGVLTADQANLDIQDSDAVIVWY